MGGNICILINSCDKYSDAWTPFFRSLEKTWPEAAELEIYLNTETKTYKDPFFNVNVLNILPGKQNNISWGERLIDAIKRTKSEFILFLLEDFFIKTRVDAALINSIFKWFSGDPSAAAAALIPCKDTETSTKCPSPAEAFGLAQRDKRVFYKLNASPSLYRKETLLKYTRKNDSPWDWEYFGSIRTWHSPLKFYALKGDGIVFDYDYGGAIFRGKWVGPGLKDIESRFNLKIETGDREVVYDLEKLPSVKLNRMPPIKRSIPRMIRNRTKYLIEYLRSLFIR